jgi:hypothetical protein
MWRCSAYELELPGDLGDGLLRVTRFADQVHRRLLHERGGPHLRQDYQLCTVVGGRAQGSLGVVQIVADVSAPDVELGAGSDEARGIVLGHEKRE